MQPHVVYIPKKRTPWICISLCLSFVLTFFASAQADQTLTVRSGNAPVGSQDSQVRVLRFGRTGDVAPTAANFASAQTSQFAYVVPLGAGSYIPQLPSDPSAKWLATTPSWTPESALYAVPFQITDPAISSATLDLHFAVDNAVNGVYINGSKISGNSFDGDYHAEYRFVRNDIAPLLLPNSTNWLYINASDYGVIASLMFSATITTSTGGSSTEGILPNHGGNAGSVTVRVSGSRFQPGALVKMTGLGTEIIGVNTVVVNSTTITSTFDLTNTQPGVWDVVVTNPDNTTTILLRSFTIEDGGGPRLWVDIVGPDRIRPGRPQTFYIVYGNSGNVDAGAVPLWIEVPTDAAVALGFDLAPAPSARLGDVASAAAPIVGDSTPISIVLEGKTLIPLIIGRVAAGSSVALPIDIAISSALLPFEVSTWLNPSWVRDLSALGAVGDPEALTCIGRIAVFGLSLPLNPYLGLFVAFVNSQIEGLINPNGSIIPAIPFLSNMIRATLDNAGLPDSQLLVGLNRAIGLYGVIQDCANVSRRIERANHSIEPVQSLDPNDKFGSDGAGPQHYMSSGAPLRYAIQFENDPSATASAQDVVIADPLLTANIDISTLALGAIIFGNRVITPPPFQKTFATTVDLRPAQDLLVAVNVDLNVIDRLLTWNFKSLDPSTHLPPADPTAGFLPPGGQGSVFFTVMPQLGLPTGTEIQNQASIVFDLNAPVLTQVWTNALDNDAPASHVLLPVFVLPPTGDFNVTWTGSDTGSGIRDYSIYVSDNGGAFISFEQNTTATSALFKGVPGHTYGFYSIARDLVGNIESPKTTPEATITVLNDAVPPSVTVVSSTDMLWPPNEKLTTVTFSGAVGDAESDVDPNSLRFTVTDEYSLLEPSGPIQVLPDGTFSFEVLLQASRHGSDADGRVYSVAVTAKDNAGNEGSGVTLVRVPHDQRN